MLLINKEMKKKVKELTGFDVRVKYIEKGSLKGAYALNNVNIKWSEDVAKKFAPYFHCPSGKLDRFSGNGGKLDFFAYPDFKE